MDAIYFIAPDDMAAMAALRSSSPCTTLLNSVRLSAPASIKQAGSCMLSVDAPRVFVFQTLPQTALTSVRTR